MSQHELIVKVKLDYRCTNSFSLYYYTVKNEQFTSYDYIASYIHGMIWIGTINWLIVTKFIKPVIELKTL